MKAPVLEPGRYGCPVCPKRFTDLSVKKLHVRTKHARPAKDK